MARNCNITNRYFGTASNQAFLHKQADDASPPCVVTLTVGYCG